MLIFNRGNNFLPRYYFFNYVHRNIKIHKNPQSDHNN